MNFRSSSTHVITALFVSAALAGCISEHHWDENDEWGEWDEETGTCVCQNPPNNNNNNNNGSESCPDAAEAIYLSRDTAVCTTIEFNCPENHESFNDSCGCGCVALPEPPSCPEENDATATYLSRDAHVCSILELSCPAGREAFVSPCGCGCLGTATTEPPPPVCPDANDPNVLYVNTDPAVCASIDFNCPQNCLRFDSECGCGCFEN